MPARGSASRSRCTISASPVRLFLGYGLDGLDGLDGLGKSRRRLDRDHTGLRMAGSGCRGLLTRRAGLRIGYRRRTFLAFKERSDKRCSVTSKE